MRTHTAQPEGEVAMALTPSDPPPAAAPLLDTTPATEREGSGDLPEVSSSFVWLLVTAIFGVYVAFVTPI
ncbi:hypothetical protein ABZZ80_46400, partial [Streptomyces sp. NPDC006356]